MICQSLLLLAAAIAVTSPIGAATEATVASPECLSSRLEPFPEPTLMGCFCGTGGTTPSDVPLSWGKGSDCDAALTNLDANTWQLADELCGGVGAEGVCQVGSLVITAECYWNGMMYQMDGYRTYKCLRCWDPPGGGDPP